jgi:hypothetical protein
MGFDSTAMPIASPEAAFIHKNYRGDEPPKGVGNGAGTSGYP